MPTRKNIVRVSVTRDDNVAVALDEPATRRVEGSRSALGQDAAMSLIDLAIVLWFRERNEDALAIYDNVIRSLDGVAEAYLKEIFVMALINKGIILGSLRRDDEEMAAYDEALKRLGDATEAPLDESVKRFGKAMQLALRHSVAVALINNGLIFGSPDQGEEVVVYDEEAARLSKAAESALGEQVAAAFLSKAMTLRCMGRYEEALSAYNEVFRQFGTGIKAGLQQRLEKALRAKTATLH